MHSTSSLRCELHVLLRGGVRGTQLSARCGARQVHAGNGPPHSLTLMLVHAAPF